MGQKLNLVLIVNLVPQNRCLVPQNRDLDRHARSFLDAKQIELT